MAELGAILARWRDAKGELDGATLATVVHVRGSAYRRPGARMLVLADGTRVGTISGGCLEGEVARKAWWWTDGGPAVRVFDSSDEGAARDFGLGCNGVITVLVERADSTPVGAVLRFLDDLRTRRETGAVATVVDADTDAPFAVGDRLLHDGIDVVAGAESGLSGLLEPSIEATLAERRSRFVHLSGGDVFVEFVAPRQRLFVFGAGHDAAPLCAVASMLGWEVIVADAHASRVAASNFPGAARVVAIPASGEIDDLGIAPDDAAILMTHAYPLDLALLPGLVRANPRYLGLLGPRDRSERLFAEAGVGAMGENVHAPVGLDLGGDRPEAIALSITAEIQAALHDRLAAPLRLRDGAIHAEAIECGERPGRRRSQVVQPECGLTRA